MVDKTVVINTKTLVSGIRRRVVMDDSSTSQGLTEVVQFEKELDKNESVCFEPKSFVQIRSRLPIEITLNNNIQIISRLFISISDINSINIKNSNEEANSISVIYG